MGVLEYSRLIPRSVPALLAEEDDPYSFTGCFNRLEQVVIRLAQADRPSSLRQAGVILRLARALNWRSVNNPLANPKLEALRRLAIMLHAKLISQAGDEIDAALAEGYSLIQLSALAAHFEAWDRLS